MDASVQAHDLTRTFGDFTAVDRVSFEVSGGEIFGFLGSNGAGKTTTIRMLCGLLPPSDGTATVAGAEVIRDPLEVQRRVGYMSQRFSLYTDLTVDENLEFWAGAYGLFGSRMRRRREWAVEASGLCGRRDVPVGELPAGYRQRLALGAALLHEPPVVFLDEPTGGVDPAARRVFWDLIDDLVAEGRTVFVTTHYMDEAERCHRVALMHAGRIIGLDTIDGLKEVFPEDTVLEVECRRAAEALEHLDEVEGVLEAALFGSLLHVTVTEPEVAERVESTLEESDFGPVELRPVAPSLEDVFIRYISDAETEAES